MSSAPAETTPTNETIPTPPEPAKQDVEQNKPAADLLVWGLVMWLANPIAILCFIGAANSYSNSGPLTFGFIFAFVGLLGFIMLMVGLHRLISRGDPK